MNKKDGYYLKEILFKKHYVRKTQHLKKPNIFHKLKYLDLP